MTTSGYYRFPSLHQETVIFVSDDDLWTVPVTGGVARRLTSGLGTVSFPAISPDGNRIAYASTEEGPREVYLMPFPGGTSRRLTFFGRQTWVTGWKNDHTLIIASDTGQPFERIIELYTLDIDDLSWKKIPVGPAVSISFAPEGKGCIIGRKAIDPARWKRYRGGTAGDLFIDRTGNGQFEKFLSLSGNMISPMWIGKRIFFISDHEGTANLYSSDVSGKTVKRHTHHEEFYARFPATNGEKIVYNLGGDLFFFDIPTERGGIIPVGFHSPQTQKNRRFVPALRNLESIDLHPQNHLLAINSRGKMFTTGNWNGPVLQHGVRQGVRYRLPTWLNDGKRVVALSDEDGEEALVVHSTGENRPPVKLGKIAVGRPFDLKVHPKRDMIALANFQNELLLVDLPTKSRLSVDFGKHSIIRGFDWSPDGRYLAYSAPHSRHTAIIKIFDTKTKKSQAVTDPVLIDVNPVFDPSGKYLFFLSFREFDPVYDNLHFELSFPKGVRPYLVLLQKNTPSPFLPQPKPDSLPSGTTNGTGAANPAQPAGNADSRVSGRKTAGNAKKKAAPPPPIDFDGIRDRILAFPVPDGRYQRIEAIDNKVLFSSQPIEGALKRSFFSNEPAAKGRLEVFDLDSQKLDTVITGISDFQLSRDRKQVICRLGNRFRLIKPGEKADETLAKEPPGKKSGWLDLNRIQVEVEPLAEWKQIFREAWRLQRDFFWTPDLSRVDWGTIYNRYYPLLSRLSTRSEFSDLIWEMQGELSTSHCYEMMGDYRSAPNLSQGFLGADFSWSPTARKWRIDRVVRGDPWNPETGSPLTASGVNAAPGEFLLQVNGRSLSREFSPMQALVNSANREISLMIGEAKGKKTRTVVVRTMSSETPARYRDWVEANRAFVHQKSHGKVGYVHVPNMGPLGFSEFHRAFLSEIDREGLIVDVRFNGGGHVSQLLLEKLTRKRVAYVQSRHYGTEPYPVDSVLGPIVALTNEHAGSDGDIFSHCFKLLKIGPLVGKRTWGGVVGIWARHFFTDGSIATQPEFSFWFQDVGWNVENYGTDPDVEVENMPQDHRAGKDRQLLKTLEVIGGLMKKHPPSEPDLTRNRPNLLPPKLSRKA
jgi:tricorn protease